MTLHHRHGGTITKVSAIAHETYKGIATWHFVGDVTWEDGSRSADVAISPICLCYDDGNVEGRSLHQALSDYLGRVGDWHEMKYKRDGRAYSWTPHKPNGQEAIREAFAQVSA